MEIYPGTIHPRGFLSLEEQSALVRQCQAIGDAPAGFYTPAVRGGAYIRIEMVCPEGGRLGLHQDKDERPETIEAGIPVVSFSLRDSAKFMIGGTRRKDQVQTIVLESGDALVMGGPSRLRYHGVSGILERTAPEAIGIHGRFNLTFCQY